MPEPWSVDITDSFNRFLGKILTFLPNLLVMITILIIGFLIAWVVKKILSRFFMAIQFDKLSERWGLTHVLSKGEVSYSPSHLLIQVFYWIIVLITLILGINALQIAATQVLITRFFNYLPQLFAAILVLIVGYLIASFLTQGCYGSTIKYEKCGLGQFAPPLPVFFCTASQESPWPDLFLPIRRQWPRREQYHRG